MRQFALFLAVGTVLVGLAFGQEDRGALGLGFASAQTSSDNLIAKAVRFNLFLDVGKKVSGKIYSGFELQGGVAQLTDQSFQLDQNDVSTYHLGGDRWTGFYKNAFAQTTYQLWNFDLSPRGYLSFDLSDKVELLGFCGLNFNWQTLNYTITNTGTSSWVDSFGTVAVPGQQSTTNLTFNGHWQAVAGLRASIAFFYIDFTRYINLGPSDLTVSNYDLSRVGAGINLRF